MANNKEIEVILVEDNPFDAELTIRSFKKHNMANNLVWLKDGAEALEYVFGTGKYAGKSEGIPKIMLLDLRLPKVDGLQVLKKIKSEKKVSGMPVIIITSSKEDRDMVESYRLGVNSFVSKPVEFDEFSNMVSQLGLYWLHVNKMPHS